MPLSVRLKSFLGFTIKYIILPLTAIGLLYFAFSGLDLRSIWEAIKGADYFFVALSFITGYAAFCFIGMRWIILLEAMGYKNISVWNSINSVSITYLANLIAPRAGEVARCTAMNQAEGIPVSRLLGTVILERAIDVIMLGSSVVLTILLQYKNIEAFFYEVITLRDENPTPSGIDYKYILIGIVVFIIIGIYIFRKKLRHTILYHKIVDFTKGMWHGITTIKHMKRKWAFVVYTILIWLMYYLMIFWMLFAFDQTRELSAANALYLFTIGGFAQLIPVQGGIGAYHMVMKIGIPILGVAAITPNIAMAFATLSHSTQMIMQIVTGGAALFFISRAKNLRMKNKTENTSTTKKR